MPESQFSPFERELARAQDEFVEHVRTMPAALATDTPEALLKKFSDGTTQGRAALHLARAALALGHRQQGRALANRGLELSEDAYILRSELSKILDAIASDK